MLIKITAVGTGKNSGNPYANDITGRFFVPKNKEMELVVGHYAYAVKTVQTMTYADDGVTLEKLETPRELLQITATFPTKAEAVEAAAEAGTLGLEVQVEVNKQAKTLGLTPDDVKALAAAW